MVVTVGGQAYKIAGVLMGSGPVWWMIHKDGKQLTGAQFDALPDAQQAELANYVKQHMDDINAGRPADFEV